MKEVTEENSVEEKAYSCVYGNGPGLTLGLAVPPVSGKNTIQKVLGET